MLRKEMFCVEKPCKPCFGVDQGIHFDSTYRERGYMTAAKLFMNGRSQAVRLPKEFRFDDEEEVLIKRIGFDVEDRCNASS